MGHNTNLGQRAVLSGFKNNFINLLFSFTTLMGVLKAAFFKYNNIAMLVELSCNKKMPQTVDYQGCQPLNK